MNQKDTDSITLYVDQETENIINDLVEVMNEEIEDIIGESLDGYKDEIKSLKSELTNNINTLNGLFEKTNNQLKKMDKSLQSHNAELKDQFSSVSESLKVKLSEALDNLNNRMEDSLGKLDGSFDELSNDLQEYIEDKFASSNSLNEEKWNSFITQYEKDMEMTKSFQLELMELKKREERINTLPGIIRFIIGSKGTLWIAEKMGIGAGDTVEQ